MTPPQCSRNWSIISLGSMSLPYCLVKFLICTRRQELSGGREEFVEEFSMLPVMIEDLTLVVFGVVFDPISELFETRFEKLTWLIDVLSAISSCCDSQNTLAKLNISSSILWNLFKFSKLLLVFCLSTFPYFSGIRSWPQLFDYQIRFQFDWGFDHFRISK